MNHLKTILHIMVLLVTVIGIMFGFTRTLVSKDVFQEFRTGTIQHLQDDVKEINMKLDLLLERTP